MLTFIVWALLLGRGTVGSEEECGGVLTSEKGVIQTPGFPGPFQVPISCQWVIDASNQPVQSAIVVYLTQLFVATGVTFTEYTFYEPLSSFQLEPKLVFEVNERNVITTNWVYTRNQYFVIEFHLEALEGNHLRVLDDLLDVYGFNITYEMVEDQVDVPPFRNDSCSVLGCSLAGNCYVSEDFEEFSCSCFSGFTGSNCEKGPLCQPDTDVCRNGATCRRSEEPGPGAYLCSCHFPDGKRENGPTLFKHNEQKRFTFSSPEKRIRKKRKLREDTTVMSVEDAPDSFSTECVMNDPLPDESSQPSTSGLSTLSEPHSCSSRWSIESGAELKAQNYFLQKEIDHLKSKNYEAFSIGQIADNDKLLNLYTGLKSYDIFRAVFKLCDNFEINYYNFQVQKVSKEDQLLICLMKLRQNFPHDDLSFRFKVSQGMITNIVITWIHVLHEVLYQGLMKNIPSRMKTRSCLPSTFSTFTNCRIILDCTEIATIVHRSSMLAQKSTYSPYKHRNTWKALIGVAPNGVVTFVSTLYPGSTSDKKIVRHSGILDQMVPGDLILADKGFLLKDILPPGVHINIPPFLSTPQFTPQQVHQTEKIARARVHVERAIQRIKMFQILNFIPQSLIPFAGKTIQVIAALSNLQNPLIKEVADQMSSTESE